ncbi:hypothetical protein CARUB_v10011213mg [Capsella rubella]|uniref:F-box domain-containing protein n=1 Tax=Capsella rubella TaxID=81985 RepID=R0GNL2_9BRAS|nr:hypothetical protein CARUB_v10011213mg [Capsella rubella]
MGIGNKSHSQVMQNKIRRRDTISELPDELLLKILSLLPTSKHATATVVLSKRWGSLWKETKSYSSRIESLHLRLNPIHLRVDINHVVGIAVDRSLRELRVEMVYNTFQFPRSLYVSSQLETLILEKLDLVDVPPNARLTCLKRLHLLSVDFPSDQSVKALLRICPNLEDLVVRRTSYTSVRIYTIDVPTLRSLSIDNSSVKPQLTNVHGFEINTPSLNVNVTCDQPHKFLKSLKSTQYLSLCCVTSHTPCLPTATSFLFLDRLELCSCSIEWWNLLIRILGVSPRLRVLELKLFKKHCVQYNDDDTMDSWNLPDSVPECLSSCLEIFDWRQYNGTKQEREAAIYILANATRLKKATFYSKFGQRLKEIEGVARGSKTCQLVFK